MTPSMSPDREAISSDPPVLYGLNARMILPLDPSKVSLRQVDNGHSGFFWTPARTNRSGPAAILRCHRRVPTTGGEA